MAGPPPQAASPGPPADPGNNKKSSKTKNQDSTQDAASSITSIQDPTSDVQLSASTFSIAFSSEEPATVAATSTTIISPAPSVGSSDSSLPTTFASTSSTSSPFIPTTSDSSPLSSDVSGSSIPSTQSSSTSISTSLSMTTSSVKPSFVTSFITAPALTSLIPSAETSISSNPGTARPASSKPPTGLYVGLALLTLFLLIGALYFLIRRYWPAPRYVALGKKSNDNDETREKGLEVVTHSTNQPQTEAIVQEVDAPQAPPSSSFGPVIVGGVMSRSNSNSTQSLSRQLSYSSYLNTPLSHHRQSSFTEHLDVDLSDYRASGFPSIGATTIFSRQSWANYPLGSEATDEDSRPPSYASLWTMGGVVLGANRSHLSGTALRRASTVSPSRDSAGRPLSTGRHLSTGPIRGGGGAAGGRLGRSNTRRNLERVNEVPENEKSKKSRRASIG